MPRKANASTAPLTADSIHKADTLVGTDGRLHYVDHVTKAGAKVKIIAFSGGEVGRWEVARHREVQVRLEQDCPCDGSGIFRGGGVVENGVYKGYEGVCFGCSGKGFQNRADMIRNHVYWAKYARIAM
jgi:hypothetical protein